MAHSQPAVPLSLRLSPQMRDQLDSLSEATGRTKSYLAAEAIKYYLAVQSWQIKAINKAVKKADSKQAKFVDHQEVVDWLASWGSDNEGKPPK